MEDVVLLSGFGPMFGLAAADLVGTRFDQRLSKAEIDRLYTLDGRVCDPMDLVVHLPDRTQKLLRENSREKPGALVTDVLESILRENGIVFNSISLKEVWSSRDCGATGPKETVSIVCISTTFMWSEAMLHAALDWVKGRFNFRYLILGGKYATLKCQKLLLNCLEVDYIITGDGEIALPRLINYLIHGADDLQQIPNLAYLDHGQVIRTQHDEINISDSPLPGFPPDQSMIMYESVRGCVFHCKFCAWSTGCEKFRFKSADQVICEWKKYIHDYPVREFQVIDSNFFIPASRMEELLKRLPELHVSWKANARTDIPADENYVSRLEQSGCVSLKFGFESMSDKVLGYINKKTTAAANRKINTLFSKSKIDTIDSFIIGFPGETPEDFLETAKYLLEEHYGHFHLYVFELEDECMPIWEDREKFHIELHTGPEREDGIWDHEGNRWSHCGMDSAMAERIKAELLQKLRRSHSKAVHRTWQGRFTYPLVEEKSREWNLSVEQLVDRLVYLPADYSAGSPAYMDAFRRSITALEQLGVFFPHESMKQERFPRV